jgi:hypothetical protein
MPWTCRDTHKGESVFIPEGWGAHGREHQSIAPGGLERSEIATQTIQRLIRY